MNVWKALVSLLLFSLVGTACSCSVQGGSKFVSKDELRELFSGEWLSPRGLGHPLLGKVFDVKRRRFLEEREVEEVLCARVLLLGEKHDNPDHQRLSGNVISFLGRRCGVQKVVFELFSSDDKAFLEIVGSVEGERLGEVLREERGYRGGFPLVQYLAPIEAARRLGLELSLGNISKEEMMRVYKKKSLLASYPIDYLSGLGLESDLPEEEAEELREKIFRSHCEALPKEKLGPMYEIQRLRDALMADALSQGSGAKTRVLLSGAEHARLDYGAGYYLKKKWSPDEVRSVAFVEVEKSKLQPKDYLRDPAQPTAPYTHLWFTAAVPPKDYCKQMSAGEESSS